MTKRIKRIKRAAALAVAATLAFLVIAPACAVEEDVIYIESAGDFSALAKKCALDSWSVGKRVVLKRDIDFSAAEFSPLPYFCGSFDGGGHTIKGIKLEKPLSDFGIIRYVSQSAMVFDLNAEVSIRALGTKNTVGAIAGVNRGTIEGCNARVTLRGGKNIGGIVGVNDAGGLINACTVKGSVYGEHSVGGIAGQNSGSITLCENKAKINTFIEEVKLDLSSLNLEKPVSADNMKEVTDIGGIAGINCGAVLKCENNAPVGVNHAGYNIGGIVGRQSGFTDNCTNNAVVYGRKDIGGIVGQAEPYTVVKYSQNSLSNAMDNLAELADMVDGAVENAAASKAKLYNRLNTLKNSVTAAGDAADDLLVYERDRANESINTANEITAKLSVLLSDCADCASELADMAASIKKLVDNDKLSENDNKSSVKQALENVSDSLDDLRRGAAAIAEGLSSMADSAKKLTMFEDSFDDLYDGINGLDDAAQKLYTSLEELVKALPNGAEQEYTAAIMSSLKLMRESLSLIKQALQNTLRYINRLDISELSYAIRKIASGTSAIKNGIADMQKASEKLESAWTLAESIGDVLGDGTKTLDKAANALNAFADSPTLSLPSFDREYLSRRDSLTSALEGITDNLGYLNDDTSSVADTVIADMRAISAKMNTIVDILTRDYDEMREKKDNLTDDSASLDEADGGTSGKINACVNNADVFGDLNVGGIAGQMAVEYDFDPEDDAEKDGKKSLNFVYKTKAVVQGCKNSGSITAKKDNAGGIVGNETLGSIKNCLACGTATSTDGDYVGGIAGASAANIDGCFSKCNTSGKSYVGGIAGTAHNIFDCRAISEVIGTDEFIGAIAGKCDGTARNNLFTADNTGGIDSVSYEAAAMRVSYDEIASGENIPEEFTYMQVSFVKGDKTIKTYRTEFGARLHDIPSVPEKKDSFGTWSVTDFSNITNDIYAYARYEKYIGAAESKLLRKNSLPAVVCEGRFSPDATVDAAKPTDCIPPKKETREMLRLSFDGCASKKVTVHYLVPDDVSNRAKIYVLSNGKWEKAKVRRDGGYLLFDIKTDAAVFACTEKSRVPIIFAAAGAFAALAAVLITKLR